MKYFSDIKTLEELRKEYKRLVKIYHPDNGGSEEEIKAINAEYEILFEILKNGSSEKEKENKYNMDEDAAIREMLNKVSNLNVNIDVVGTWIWIGGNTYSVKETLNSLGFKWCSNKKMWAWHYGEWKRVRGKRSYEQIKEKYGYTNIKREKEDDKLE